VSSELERQLREARDALPAPDEPATQRARGRALATIRPARTRTRRLVLVGAMLICAVTLGFTAGSLNAPPGTAAREPDVLGFVPEPGWFALQSPPPAVPGQQTVAVAANVPFAADDVKNGLVEPSGLPYSTLLMLPPDGIVIVATMTPESEPRLAPILTGATYPTRELPLRLRDGFAAVQWGAQVRPDGPMAQYHLGANLRGYNVDVVVYFGTPDPQTSLMRSAQNQLDGFVARPEGGAAASRPAAASSPARTLAAFDRTYACSTVILGGVYGIETRAHAGIRSGKRWSKLPYAVVSSGGWAGLLIGYPYARDNSVAWVTAGAPSHDTTADVEGENFPVETGGTLGVNKSLCRPSRAAVPLRSTGLRGGSAGVQGEAFDCGVPRRIFVRVRATTLSAASLSARGKMLVATNAVIRRAELAVRAPSGKPLVYATVAETGKAKATLFTARNCVPD
jgi:hypothetical protein